MKGFNILKCARNSTFFHFVKVNYTVSLLYYKDTLHKRVIKNESINLELGENGTINESINPELGGNGTINPETGENESINGTINENHMLMLSMILHNPTITIKMMCEKTGLSKTTIHRYIKELKELGYLERIGSRKNGTWIVCCSGLEKTNKE